MSTPEYTKRAIENYRRKFDVIQLRADKGTKDRIKALTSESVNVFINKAIQEKLKQLENNNKQ